MRRQFPWLLTRHRHFQPPVTPGLEVFAEGPADCESHQIAEELVGTVESAMDQKMSAHEYDGMIATLFEEGSFGLQFGPLVLERIVELDVVETFPSLGLSVVQSRASHNQQHPFPGASCMSISLELRLLFMRTFPRKHP